MRFPQVIVMHSPLNPPKRFPGLVVKSTGTAGQYFVLHLTRQLLSPKPCETRADRCAEKLALTVARGRSEGAFVRSQLTWIYLCERIGLLVMHTAPRMLKRLTASLNTDICSRAKSGEPTPERSLQFSSAKKPLRSWFPLREVQIVRYCGSWRGLPGYIPGTIIFALREAL